jgi:hypothetical protein
MEGSDTSYEDFLIEEHCKEENYIHCSSELRYHIEGEM